MKMVTQIAFANMKYHRSRNILIGVAMILTTLLLFLVPSVGMGMVNGQFAVVNELYPTWHALYRGIDQDTADRLSMHRDISRSGLRSDTGAVPVAGADISMMYLDQEGLFLYKMDLTEGTLPQKENEIVVSKGILDELGISGEIGSTVKIPYQVYRDGGLDFTQEKQFIITGFLPDTEASIEARQYVAIVSKEFLFQEVPKDQIAYRFLFQIDGNERSTTDQIEEAIKQIAAQFGISENDTNINTEYLAANYVDPAFVPGIAAIMLVIVIAGMITIYSIYYITMNDSIKEYGKLKAIGTTKRQLRQIVLRESYCVALFAVPIGLLLGTVLVRAVMRLMTDYTGDGNLMMETMRAMIDNNGFVMYHWWIYLLAVVILLVTVYLSLLRPMRIAAKVSEIEAIRYQEGTKNSKKSRKSRQQFSVPYLARINLAGNKRKNLITICSMGITGTFLMVVATVLSCANPVESANSSILGQYRVTVESESGNKEHPEREWSEIVKNNPLSDDLKDRILAIDGVDRVECFTRITVDADELAWSEQIRGIPESYAKELEQGIIEGSVTYEELKSGDKVVIDKNLLHWHPDLSVGDKLLMTIQDGDSSYQKEIEIAAIGDYPHGFSIYEYFLMAKEGADSLIKNNGSGDFEIYADRQYDETVEQQIRSIMSETSDLLNLSTWQNEYETWKSALSMTNAGCYSFLAILGAISIMNLVNTMVHSLHARRKEIGMMQAVGMTNRQLILMLQMEGLFYTLGTLIVSVGLGSILGYPVFLWAKENGMFNISQYHYPLAAAVLVTAVMVLVQMILALALGSSVRKESLIERIRFSE